VNGQWSYGKPTTVPKDIPTISERKPTASGGVVRFDVPEKVKPKVTRKIPIRKQRDGEAAGDNSNTQYAVLGPYDFVTILEAPDNETVSSISIEMGARGSVQMMTMPAIPLDTFINRLERGRAGTGRKGKRR